jgi:ATP-binding protein involved in chromosome partitioning
VPVNKVQIKLWWELIMVDKNEVKKILNKIQDPELRRPLTELDMVKSVNIDGGEVTIEILLTIAGCPLRKKISDDITDAVGKIDGVERVKVILGVMTDEQRKNLTAKLYGTSRKKESEEIKPIAGDFARRVIAVSSGKGGVGKSTVTANLAAALNRLGYKVGVIDADVYGFSIPRILGISGQPTIIDDHIVPLRREGIQVVSIGFFIDEDQPVIWRGPLLHKTINQFICDVFWDKLDFLLIDLPPGTGDVSITISQALPKAELLVVTTPQPLASNTAGRVGKMADKTKLSVLGVIENMSYYESNGKRDYIFGKGGGKKLARKLGVPFMGEIPIKTEIREAADSGNPVVLSNNTSIAEYYLKIARSIAEKKQ